MSYFARFKECEGHPFRLDTRIYLRDEGPGVGDRCVAAIIGKNPGSARGKANGRLTPAALGGDKFLPVTRNRFRNAYGRAGVEIPGGAYVRVWNLFYLCDKALRAAVRAHAGVRRPVACDSERERPPIVWFAWGPPTPWSRPMVPRFLDPKIEHPFYYDMDLNKVVAGLPGPTSRVRHTQGLSAEPVEVHLATILRTRGPTVTK